MGRISVVIPTYNRANLLAESIRAIQTQTYPVHEIIVVDDGSTDRTSVVASDLSNSIKYVYQCNSGKSVALNTGLVYCSGDYIWICDDDDLALPHAAEMLLSGLESNVSAGFSFGKYKVFSVDPDSGRRQIAEPSYWPDLESTSILVGLLEDCFIFQNASLVRRKALDAVGPFRPDLLRSQDYEMTIRLTCQFDAVFVHDVVFLQRAHDGHRGTAAERFSSSRQMEKWLHYDGIIFRKLYDEIPLARFAPKQMVGLSNQVVERAALLQRACIFWRRKLWEFSLADLASAIRTKGDDSLTETEELICRRFVHQKFGCDELISKPDLVEELYRLSAENAIGLAIVQALTEPLVWYVRQRAMHRRWADSISFAKIVLRIHGLGGTSSLVASRAGRHLKLAGSSASRIGD
jgi:glycosyltransferase involved in cell wall biosynthesis